MRTAAVRLVSMEVSPGWVSLAFEVVAAAVLMAWPSPARRVPA